MNSTELNVINTRTMICSQSSTETEAILWEDEEGMLYETCMSCNCFTWSCEK